MMLSQAEFEKVDKIANELANSFIDDFTFESKEHASIALAALRSSLRRELDDDLLGDAQIFGK